MPHDRVWLTLLRLDCAVELFSFNTRLDFVAAFELDCREEDAQFKGIELLVLLVTGKLG